MIRETCPICGAEVEAPAGNHRFGAQPARQDATCPNPRCRAQLYRHADPRGMFGAWHLTRPMQYLRAA